ncbi:MAG TPA: cysteine desulfurase family protein [Acidimicrobiia bacterium]
MTDLVYLDHAASTPMRPEAIAAMLPYLADHPANPSGGHDASRAAKTALEAARENVADVLGCRPDEVVFTGSGSESDNLAVKGAAWAARARGAGEGAVVSAIEHKAVLGAAHRLEAEGHHVCEVLATASGAVDLERLRTALDGAGAHVAVVSVMTVNNETGTEQPLADVATIVHDRAPNAVLHTDAVQAPQWVDLARHAASGFDLVSLSGHKFGGPKGVGVLVRRNGVELTPLVEGGGHEWSLRAGTQNVAGIVALATALRVTHHQRAEECARIAGLRDRLEAGVIDRIGGVVVNGDRNRRVAGVLHVAIEGVEAETLLVALDAVGVCAASGSACSSGAIEPSHVLLAMGMDPVRARASIRMSLGWASTDADIDAAIERIPAVVHRLRERAA